MTTQPESAPAPAPIRRIRNVLYDGMRHIVSRTSATEQLAAMDDHEQATFMAWQRHEYYGRAQRVTRWRLLRFAVAPHTYKHHYEQVGQFDLDTADGTISAHAAQTEQTTAPTSAASPNQTAHTIEYRVSPGRWATRLLGAVAVMAVTAGTVTALQDTALQTEALHQAPAISAAQEHVAAPTPKRPAQAATKPAHSGITPRTITVNVSHYTGKHSASGIKDGTALATANQILDQITPGKHGKAAVDMAAKELLDKLGVTQRSLRAGRYVVTVSQTGTIMSAAAAPLS